jgi:hypothetical protein
MSTHPCCVQKKAGNTCGTAYTRPIAFFNSPHKTLMILQEHTGFMDDDLEQPRKRARRGSKKSNGAAEDELGGAQIADRKARGTAKGNAPKKAKKGAKKARSSVKASPATDWCEDSSQQDFPSDSDLDLSEAYGSDSSDEEDDEFSVKYAPSLCTWL